MDILELIHIETHQNQCKPHKCTMMNCKKAFGRRSDLARHLRIHSNERPYGCQEVGCGKNFIQRSALKVHMRTHSGERPHVCEFEDCKKNFSDSSSLARHRRIHTGKRPYKCRQEGCNKSFVRKTVLTTHQKVSHGLTTKRTMLQWRPFNEIPELIKQRNNLQHAAAASTGTSKNGMTIDIAKHRINHSAQSSSLPPSPAASLPSPTIWKHQYDQHQQQQQSEGENTDSSPFPSPVSSSMEDDLTPFYYSYHQPQPQPTTLPRLFGMEHTFTEISSQPIREDSYFTYC